MQKDYLIYFGCPENGQVLLGVLYTTEEFLSQRVMGPGRAGYEIYPAPHYAILISIILGRYLVAVFDVCRNSDIRQFNLFIVGE